MFPGEPLNAPDIEFIPYYKGSRLYNNLVGDRWVWSETFKAKPGEFFFTEAERSVVKRMGLPKDFVVVEPNTNKALHPNATFLINKQWPLERYKDVVDAIRASGHHVVQFVYGNHPRLPGAYLVATPSYRAAAAILAKASLYIGSEGGLHHAAAAVGVPGVVMFGAWLPPAVLGYDFHSNLTGGATTFCGLLRPCEHCRAAMDAITVDEALTAARERLKEGRHVHEQSADDAGVAARAAQ